MSGWLSGGAGGGGGYGGRLVWEWNKTDISQFVSSSPQYTFGSSPVGSIAVTPVAGWGNVLRITGSGTNIAMVWLAADALPFVGEARNHVIEMELRQFTNGGGGYVGVSFLADTSAGSYSGLAHYVFGTANWSHQVSAGSLLAGGTTSALGNAGSARWEIRGIKPAGAPPQISSWSTGWLAGISGVLRRCGPNVGAASGVGLFANAEGAMPASWNDLACDRFGITIQSSGGNPSPTNVDILALRVYLLD